VRGPAISEIPTSLLAESGLEAQLGRQRISFVDLNLDELCKVPTRATYTGLDHRWLPRTVLASDFIVSMPKIKTLLGNITKCYNEPRNGNQAESSLIQVFEGGNLLMLLSQSVRVSSSGHVFPSLNVLNLLHNGAIPSVSVF
jgi:hypothetical protein